MEKELLQKWLDLKKAENAAKEERVALEEQIWNEYGYLCEKKMSGTENVGEYKVTIKMNPKYKVIDEDLIPEGVDVYKTVLDDKKLADQYKKGADWVEKQYNKPTFTVVKVC